MEEISFASVKQLLFSSVYFSWTSNIK